MGKKRKASGRPFGWERAASTAQDPDNEPSKLAINSYEDVADSEDDFHIGRDKVLLDEGPHAKRQRKWQAEGKIYPDHSLLYDC